MSHMPLATVSLGMGTAYNFSALVSSVVMDTISIAAGSTSSSAIMYGFLYFAILYALYDASCTYSPMLLSFYHLSNAELQC